MNNFFLLLKKYVGNSLLILGVCGNLNAQELSGSAVLSEVTDNPKLKCWHDGAESITMIDSALNRTHSTLNNSQRGAHTLQKYTGTIETVNRMDKATEPDSVQSVKTMQEEMAATLDAEIKDAKQNIQDSLDNAIYTKSMLDMATIEATKEEEIERKMYSSCIATLTRYSYRAYEQVRFFFPRQISDGTAHDLSWMSKTDDFSEQISNKIIFKAGRKYQDAKTAYDEIARELKSVAENYKSSFDVQNMSDRMRAMWSCGQSLTATAGILTWTRSPNDIEANNPTERYNNLMEMMNTSFENVKYGCQNQIKGILPAVVNELKVCQAWAADFKHYLRLCSREDVPPTIIDDSIENATGSQAFGSFAEAENRLNTAKFEVSKVLKQFANEYEQTPFYRIIYARVLAKIAEARVNNLKNSLDVMKQQSEHINGGSSFINRVKSYLVAFYSSLVKDAVAFDPFADTIKDYKLGCLTLSKSGSCKNLRELVYRNRYIYRDDKYTQLKVLMAEVGDELRKSGATTTRAKELLEVLESNGDYIKQSADLAVAEVGRRIYNDPMAIDLFSGLVLQDLEISSESALGSSGVNNGTFKAKNSNSRKMLVAKATERTNFIRRDKETLQDNYLAKNEHHVRKSVDVRGELDGKSKSYQLVDQADINIEKERSIFKIISQHYTKRVQFLTEKEESK